MKYLDLDEIIKNRKNLEEMPATEARSSDGRFRLVEKEFPWGKRNVYIPIETEFNEQLQASRGIALKLDGSIEEIKDQVINEVKNIDEGDIIRIEELDFVIDKVFRDRSFRSFCEIGFRIPRLQNFYKERGMRERGFDINRFNVDLGKSLGFDCREFNINKQESIDISDCDLIVCYHVLEHVSDPFSAVKLLYNSASPGSVFHIEIPVEEDGPRLNYGHLYPFFREDMAKMLLGAGFRIGAAGAGLDPRGNSPWVERYCALKE